VNVVAPGYVRTEMTDELDAETREAILDAVTLDRLAKPDEIADAVLFLASPAAAYITGHVLHVNGGLSM
jgi:3-oxoacyl-[acyl-carrier protein] reductase